MIIYKWKRLDNYCLLDINTTGVAVGDRILEIGILKVVNNEIVDKFYSKVNPNYKRKDKLEEYKDYLDSPTFDNIAEQVKEFIGNNAILGWCVDFDILHVQLEGGFLFDGIAVDLYVPYYRDYKNILPKCSLENVYKKKFSNTEMLIDYDFCDVIDKCKATKQLYDSRNDHEMLIRHYWQFQGKKVSKSR